MQKEWVKPKVMVQFFVPNEYVAACYTVSDPNLGDFIIKDGYVEIWEDRITGQKLIHGNVQDMNKTWHVPPIAADKCEESVANGEGIYQLWGPHFHVFEREDNAS